MCDDGVTLLSFSAAEYGHCVDAYTLKNMLDLWKALVETIQRQEATLPSGRFLLPPLIAYWNWTKGGIDVFSQHLKNV